MPAFKFKSILLHRTGENGGWEVIGIGHNNGRITLAELHWVVGSEQAQQFADRLAKNLAGKAAADVD